MAAVESTTAVKRFAPSKKKRGIYGWIGGVFVVLLLLFAFQLFGPSAQVVVSPQTTRITGPLRLNGLPDFEQYMLDQARAGVTPDNNAAALLWPALFPGGFEPPQYEPVAKELGLNSVPSKTDAVVPVYDWIEDWVKTQLQVPDDPDMIGEAAIRQELAIRDVVMSRPWTSERFPWLAEWAIKNRQPLDKMLAASKRPRCYIPSPMMLDQQNDRLGLIEQPGVHEMSEIGRSLMARAMWHVGEQNPMAAWQDLHAIHRIGRLIAQGPSRYHPLVGIDLDCIAAEGTAMMLDDSDLTPQQAQQVLSDLQGLAHFSGKARCVDELERLTFVDTVSRFGRGEFGEDGFDWDDKHNIVNNSCRYRVNWNAILHKGNEWFDRYVAAVQQPTFEARVHALAQLENEFKELKRRLGPGTIVASVLNPTARNAAVAAVLVDNNWPFSETMMDAHSRAGAKLDLLRLAAALAVYRAEQGTYPAKLDELVPGILPQPPVDLFHAKSYVYRRMGTGYLLYTSGANGQDDGGSNRYWSIFEGYSHDDFSWTEGQSMREKIHSDADDFAIRLPRPPRAERFPPPSQ